MLLIGGATCRWLVRAMNAPPDERVVLREVMARPWLLSAGDWAFIVGLAERSDVPFDAMEKIRLGKLQCKIRRMTNDD
jgi:hypothetical protein